MSAITLTRQCCQCKRVWHPTLCRWVRPVELEYDRQNVTHGYCQSCIESVQEMLDAERSKLRYRRALAQTDAARGCAA